MSSNRKAGSEPISKTFVTAGQARFTIELPAGAHVGSDGTERTHYTYSVERSEPSDRFPNPAYFAKLLTGPNNTDSACYSYLGVLDEFTGQVRPTAKSRIKPDSYAFRLLNRILARVWSEDHAAYEQHGFMTHHEGCCGRCGRTLTHPESIKDGIGPECRKIMGLAPLSEKKPRKPRKAKGAKCPDCQGGAGKDHVDGCCGECVSRRLLALTEPAVA